MCLGIPGQIVEITDEARLMAMADVSGVKREVSLAPVSDRPLADLVGEWVLINGSFSALGALIALGHPLTIAAAFVGAPLTSLNPTIGVGFVTAGVELYLRRPTVGDFSRLRSDVSHWRGWWRNRVARTLLVFLLSSLGSAIATWVAGLRIAGQLFG